jgi:histidinol phosphatase-like enzyme
MDSVNGTEPQNKSLSAPERDVEALRRKTGSVNFQERGESHEYDLASALVLDLDGTVRHSKSGGYIDGPDDIEMFEGVEEYLRRKWHEGTVPLGLTNQVGVAYDHKKTIDIENEIEATTSYGGSHPLGWVHYTPFMKAAIKDEYDFRTLTRKPYYGALSLLRQRMMRCGILVDWDQSVMVGDRPEDRACAKAAEIPFVEATVWRAKCVRGGASELDIAEDFRP